MELLGGRMTQSSRRHSSTHLLLATCFLITTLTGVLGQQQSFRRRPENVEVKMGDTAVLRCEIENQAGKAQWTKDGFALGFLREIPNFNRYSMVGDADRGVHNLRIINVSLSDIAEYQCQVGPTKLNKAIRSDAHLNVLVPPKSIEIQNHAPNATITLKEKDPTELECIVREARPAATIFWFRNDAPFRPESSEDSTEEVEVLEENILIKKNTTRSKIKILPTAEDDRARYTCEGRHPALPRPKGVTVYLSVQYPPGAPRIDGYTEGDTIRENQSVTLICISRGGNPLAELIWYKNDVRIDSSYSTRVRESRNELSFIASTKDNLVRYRCEASNIMSTTPKIADVTLTVMFAPKEVKITGPTEAKVGDLVSLTCTSSNSNPRAEVAWFKGGVALEDYHVTPVASTDGGYITSSNVSFRIDPNDRKESYTCQAVNRGLGESKSSTHTINVIQPPGMPRIYKSKANITAGSMQRITCTSTGGHPPATITWYRAGKKVESTYTSDANMASAELAFEANMTDNGVQYKCEAKNKALTTPLVETVTFSVLFPPGSVSITTKPTKLKEGEKGYLTCESASSNPPAKVAFLKDSQDITTHLNQTYKDGKYGGKKTSITLELDLTSELDGALYTCEAKNHAIKQSAHNTITLNVKYKPKFVETAGEKVSVVEGESSVITVRAKGNPDLIKYKWAKNGSQLKTQAKKVLVEGPVLNFTEVNRKDKGKYECEASNSEGATTLIIDLDVQYPATIHVPSDSKMVGQHENAHLECAIDANPLDDSMVQWKYGDAEITRPTQRKFQDKKAYLTILDANVSDAGEYACYVNNGIGQPVNKTIFLIVKHKPDIDKSPKIAKAASNKGEIGKLICRAKGAPNVTFSWNRKDGVSINATNSSKYAIQTQMVDRMTFESTLEIADVGTEDYGWYGCIAHNELDDDTHDVKLDVTSVPDVPIGFRVVNFTDNAVTLTWDPAFDGGFEQSYRIMYQAMGDSQRRYIDVQPKNTTTFTVTQLERGQMYSFSVMSTNALGDSNYTTESVRQQTSNFDQENQLSQMMNGRPDIPKIVIISVSAIGTLLLLLNIIIVSYFIYKKKNTTKTKQDEASEQGSSKSATIEMYAPSSYNETVTGETLSSISEKSATYSHGDNHDDYIEDGGKGTGVSTYLVEHINHHSSGYPYRDMGGMRASTLPRQPKHHGSPLEPHGHAEDDGYVDALRRNAYNQGVGDKVQNYGRTTPRPATSRPPQVPPIPELYNIPPEARYVPYPPPGFGSPVGNGSIRNMSHSTSHDMLNSNQPLDHMSSFHQHLHQRQPNGHLMVGNGPLSPHRGSILTTFVPNPSPNIEHEGHLV